MTTAIESIQSEASSLTTVRIMSAIEAADWVAVAKLAMRLSELAVNGMHHESLIRARSMGSFAMGNHAETDAR